MEQQELVNILIVDDQPSNLDALELILSQLGQRVSRVSSDLEALECLQREEFSMIILDVSRPKMNRFELAERIRTFPKLQHIPLIFLSETNFDDHSLFRGYELGAVDYLVKSIHPQILLSKITVFIDLFQQKRKLERIKASFALEIQEYRHIEEIISNIALGFSSIRGEAFLRFLVQYLAQVEGIDYAFIGKLNNLESLELELVAFYGDEKFNNNEGTKWSFKGLPSEKVLQDGFAIYPAHLSKYFPNVPFIEEMKVESYAGIRLANTNRETLGILGIMGRRPLKKLKLTAKILQIFASRASIDLEQESSSDHKYTTLEPQNLREELERRIQETTVQLHQANQQLRQEIWEREQSELALRDSENLFGTIFEYAPLGIALMDMEGRPFKTNSALQKFLGYNEEELAQIKFVEFTHPDDIEASFSSFQEMISQRKESYSLKKRYLRKDGRIVWGQVTASLVCDLQGIPRFAIKMIKDIDKEQAALEKRKIAEEALKENQAFLRHVIDSAPNLIFVKDGQGKYILVNRSFAQAFNTTIEELQGKTGSDFSPNSLEVSRHLQDDQKVLTFLQTLLIPEETVTLADGTVIYLQTVKTPLIAADGKAYHVLGVSTDITERKKAEKEIEKALKKEKELNQLKTEFIDLVSHEFRTPLTSVLGYADLLEFYGEKFPEDKKQKQIRNIRIAAKRLKETVEDILCISRVDSGKVKLNSTPVNVVQFSQDLLEDIRIGIGKEHHFELILPESSQILRQNRINIDEKILRHILINLLSNAVKYSPPGSRVELILELNQQTLSFSVKDQGIGIPDEDQNYLYEAFHRANNVGDIPGTGLGLNIVHKYVSFYKGTIELTSQVGVGTTFKVILPCL